MNNDVSEIAVLIGVSVAVNAVYAIQKGKNAVVTVVAGGFLFVALALVGGITGRYDIARAMGAVFLLSSALFHGIPLVESATSLSQNAHTVNNEPATAPAVAQTPGVNSPYFRAPGGRMIPQ